MSQITCHILDTARGTPATGVAVSLSRLAAGNNELIASGSTNTDGRVSDLLNTDTILAAGTYQVHFATAGYFEALGEPIFYPWADVVFNITGDGQHYHIPLLLAPFGYSTYRGS